MSAISQIWKVRKSAVNYDSNEDGSSIELRANSFSEATILFDNTDGALNTVFAEEDEVEVYIGDHTVALNKMMVGYINRLIDEKLPTGRKLLKLEIVDWVSYLSGKTAFERDSKRTKTASQFITMGISEIAGLSSNVTAMNTSAENMKRSFRGTYVKDLWDAIQSNVGADYYGDETKTIQFFLNGARNLLHVGTGNIYTIRDIAPTLGNHLMVDHKYPFKFERDVSKKYRTVIATNGITETYPTDPNLYQTAKVKDDSSGKTFSGFYQRSATDFNIDTNTIPPVQFLPSTDVGAGLVMPTIRVLSSGVADVYPIILRGIEFDDTGVAYLLQNIGLVPEDWQNIGLFLKNALSGAVMTNLYLRLYQDAGNLWQRDIKADLNGSAFTHLLYDLPTQTSLVETYSGIPWTKTGLPTVINRIGIEPAPSTGWTAKTYLEFGMLHFFRRRRATVTGAGSPATEKIIVDATNKGVTGLTTLATKEQARANQTQKSGICTIDGNVNFKNPAHNIAIDFTTTFGTGRSGTIQMEQIKHYLTNGVHKTEIHFSPSMQLA